MIKSLRLVPLLALLAMLPWSTRAFVSHPPSITPAFAGRSTSSSSPTQIHVLPAAAASLLAGSIGGAVGVGIAFPLDSIKTRQQVMATASPNLASMSTAIEFSPDGTAVFRAFKQNNSLLHTASTIWQTEGLAGFFGGVQTSMAGQAIIKAVVFAVNAAVLDACRTQHILEGNPNVQLLVAAATAGFVTAFLAAPVDRIKVLMQASSPDKYHGRDEECLQAVLDTEGWKGLLSRGLGCTMIREVPAYTLYFGVYGALQASALAAEVGPAWSPLLFGAMAGCACWIPIYPIDVVKTVVQNTQGEGGASGDADALQVAMDLYQQHGIGVFWDGIVPRLLRQAVNHAVTFAVYEAIYTSFV